MAHKSLNPAASLKTFFDFVFFSRSNPSDFETRDAPAAVEKGLLSFLLVEQFKVGGRKNLKMGMLCWIKEGSYKSSKIRRC